MRLLRSHPDGLVRPQGCRVRDLSCGDTRIFLQLEVRRLDCRGCGKVKRERLISGGQSALPLRCGLPSLISARRNRVSQRASLVAAVVRVERQTLIRSAATGQWTMRQMVA